MGRTAFAEVDRIIADNVDPDVAKQMDSTFVSILRALVDDEVAPS